MFKLFTIGHSNRTLDEFLSLLQSQKIRHLVDIRTIPKSRHVPWSNQGNLYLALKKAKIHYTHLPELGGLRKTDKNSINLGWRNSSFRGFADYMQTREFYLGLKKLNQIIKQDHPVVIMCAEALPWRCHRSLIADAETARGVLVYDIISTTSVHIHQLTSFAVINRKKRPIQIYYPSIT